MEKITVFSMKLKLRNDNRLNKHIKKENFK